MMGKKKGQKQRRLRQKAAAKSAEVTGAARQASVSVETATGSDSAQTLRDAEKVVAQVDAQVLARAEEAQGAVKVVYGAAPAAGAAGEAVQDERGEQSGRKDRAWRRAQDRLLREMRDMDWEDRWDHIAAWWYRYRKLTGWLWFWHQSDQDDGWTPYALMVRQATEMS